MSGENWTVRKILTWTTQHFEKRGVDAPRLTTEVLLAHALKTTRVRLYVDLDRPLEKTELATFRALIERRMAGEPTQYLTGVREFYNRPFKVDARVLIPRPETELLVEAALHKLPKDGPGLALDVCTGSGCIAISLAAERPQATVMATDLSADACALARENAQALGVAERVTVLQGNLYAPLPPDARFDVVVSNPPYIATTEIPTLSAEVRREPHMALDGGPDGLVLIRKVIEGARRVLKPGGLLAMEIGETQGEAVKALLQAAGYADARVEKDLERRDRLAFGTQPVAV
ncbi:protein-(glutamine-N5) methyltransferase, release factor-specific [Archangium sp. Cb G35]|uniref:peptide chain release factor N(5)-glutamine methyltransferase n=1 Tax=Archangium sp. Cb G35 TaxID=1920190 RepID=UPI0009358EEA|nr:peptide chain release factor N(5)-glutamine methyltransferase [Archangium sp. Cb G35]OJT16548.1 protein-(glutamine-N5) methyltransferase, release factor-specific [Archangium sp. Cb G35]WNG56401.1 peptide chain release factor N(5)-glutamine methyltransferase [Archangium gephyra]